MEWEEWDGMTKLQDMRRWGWVFNFEEVPLVVVAGLSIEFTKNRDISSYWLWWREFWRLVLGEREVAMRVADGGGTVFM